MRKLLPIILVVLLLTVSPVFAQGDPEKVQDLGETHEVWLTFVGQNAVLTFVGKSPSATPVMISIVGGQNVTIDEPLTLGQYHRLYRMHIALQFQPDKECLIIVGNNTESTPAVWCEGLFSSVIPTN